MRDEGSIARIRLNEVHTKTSLEVTSTTYHINETERLPYLLMFIWKPNLAESQREYLANWKIELCNFRNCMVRSEIKINREITKTGSVGIREP